MNPPASITRLTLVLGGVRSGKSAFTEGLVKSLDATNPNFPVTYLATGLATDAEMSSGFSSTAEDGRPTGLHRKSR